MPTDDRGIDVPSPKPTPHHRINVDQENTMKLTDLHVRRLGRVNPGWGINRLPKAVYVMAFGRGVSIRWCQR